MRNPALGHPVVLLAALVLAACASTSIRSAWFDASYAGGPFRKILPQLTQYDVASVETNLWDVKTRRVVWAASTATFNPRSVQQETPGFADLIIGQLVARGLAPGATK